MGTFRSGVPVLFPKYSFGVAPAPLASLPRGDPSGPAPPAPSPSPPFLHLAAARGPPRGSPPGSRTAVAGTPPTRPPCSTLPTCNPGVLRRRRQPGPDPAFSLPDPGLARPVLPPSLTPGASRPWWSRCRRPWFLADWRSAASRRGRIRSPPRWIRGLEVGSGRVAAPGLLSGRLCSGGSVAVVGARRRGGCGGHGRVRSSPRGAAEARLCRRLAPRVSAPCSRSPPRVCPLWPWHGGFCAPGENHVRAADRRRWRLVRHVPVGGVVLGHL